MELALDFLQNEPIFSFAVLLAVILIVPIFFERLQLPGLIGLLAAGVVLGPHGLQLLQRQSETMKLLSDIGVVYLMFVAGLEMDMAEFRKVQNRAIGFGSLTFILPLIAGTLVGRSFGFSWNASILIGSLLSSHTPLGYPILSRLGLMGNEAVIVTIGGTIFTNIPALLVLAVCVSVHAGNFTLSHLAFMLVALIIYSAIVLFGFDWAGREFFRRSGDEEGNQFLFVLLAVFLAAVGAQLIGVEKIVGAFLAGMAVNGALGSGPVKEKVVFVGSVLFIPIFMVNLGLLIDLPAFIETLTSFWLTLAIVLALLGSKLIAAVLTQLWYRYTRTEMITIWSLSIPQVAATLAATIVGYNTLNPAGDRLLSEDVLNAVIVMMLVTATLGPFVTSRAAVRLTPPTTNIEDVKTPFDENSQQRADRRFTVVVPVYNPETERNLVEMAALLARHEGGRIVPLSIARAIAQMEAADLDIAIDRSEMLVAAAVQLSQTFGVNAQPVIRIDNDVAQGISHASREQHASLIVMGWGETSSLRARLFGNVIDRVLWASHCPVAVTRLLDSPMQMQRILVPVDNLVARAVLQVRFADSLAQVNEGNLTLLHVCDRRTPPEVNAQIESQLLALVTELESSDRISIVILPHDDLVDAILQQSRTHDLVILQATQRRTMSGLEIDDVTTEVVQQLRCSLVMLGEV